MHRGPGGGRRGRGRVNIGPPQANFKTPVNKNEIRLKKAPPMAIFPESLDPLDFQPVHIYASLMLV
jgi:hypothetical protein